MKTSADFRTVAGRMLVVWAACWLTISPAHAVSIRINEIMASNGSTLADEDGDFPNWIELYHAGTEPVDLSGWGLSDDPDEPFRWTFPVMALQPGEYLLVFASGKDRRPPQAGSSQTIDPIAPDSIDGLVLWLKADALDLQDGATIAVWSDQSGFGNDAVQTDAVRRPVFRSQGLAGKPAIEFDQAASQYLSISTQPFHGMTDLRNMTLLVKVQPHDRLRAGLIGTPATGSNAGPLRVEFFDNSTIFYGNRSQGMIAHNGATPSVLFG